MLLPNSEYVRYLDKFDLTNNQRSPLYHQQAFVGVWRSLFLIAIPIAIVGSLTAINSARAQLPPIAADGSLSTTVSTPDGSNFTINNGDRVGENLFHSFSRFSVPNNGSAVFQNPTDVQNVISRVTGGSLSNIEGLIKAQGSANLFLLNPAGIVFGKGARLEIGGSFFSTTANSLLFDGGVEFSATNLQTPPLLSVNIPIGLRFRDNPGNITNLSVARNTSGNTVGLQVPLGKTLALVGGDVTLDGGRLTAPGGKIELGGLTAEGTVGLNAADSLSFPNGIARGDVSLKNFAFVNVLAAGGGSVTINPKNLNIAGESIVLAGIRARQGSVDSKAGDIDINATGAISLTDQSIIANVVQSRAVGKAGSINIKGESLSLTRGAILNAGIFGEGEAGDINIDVRDGVNVAGVENIREFNNDFSTDITTAVFEGGKGDGGDINIKARYLTLSDTARIDPMVYGEGNAGSAFIETKDFVSLSRAAIYSSVSFNGIGDGGNIKIKTGTLSLIGNKTFPNETFLSVNTFNQGNTGSVFIKADAVYISKGASIESNVYENAVGDSRDINITTGLLSLTDGAQISANSQGNGAAGNIKVFANSIELDNKSTIRADTIGRQGNINLHSGNLVLRRNSKITTNATGTATGGNITIDTDNLVAFPNENSDITANAFSGSGGKITINTQGLFGMVVRSRTELERLL
ncbi:MAG: filamentous hemagglutinin N-terminal domain-containing protein, partial [Fischerella sp.]|nr:filamentous hemagglutinin N-terminal domain-containing protein [Fischerella sp.]